MSTLFTRLREIMLAQQHAALDTLENPRHMSAQLLRDTETDLAAVRNAMLGTAVRLKQIRRNRKQLELARDQHQAHAATALRQGREDEAREQLGLKLRQEGELQQLGQLQQQLESTLESLRKERQSLKHDRAELGSQLRMLDLQAPAMSEQDGLDRLYQQRMNRRERMANYATRSAGDLDALQCAQALREEESPCPVADANQPDIEAELATLKHQITAPGASA